MESVVCEAGEFPLELSGIKDPLEWSGLHVGCSSKQEFDCRRK
jgi:hypothetical protein